MDRKSRRIEATLHLHFVVRVNNNNLHLITTEEATQPEIRDIIGRQRADNVATNNKTVSGLQTSCVH